jgi:hypothetical protein
VGPIAITLENLNRIKLNSVLRVHKKAGAKHVNILWFFCPKKDMIFVIRVNFGAFHRPV